MAKTERTALGDVVFGGAFVAPRHFQEHKMREEDKKPTFIAEVPDVLPMEKELRRQEELDRVIGDNQNAEVQPLAPLPLPLPSE